MHLFGFLVSLTPPTKEQEDAICAKGQRLGLNYGCPGATQRAPPLPAGALEDGWWAVDHLRLKVGYGRKTYEDLRRMLLAWGHFQQRWAYVRPETPIKPGGAMCVAANVAGLWTAVPLRILYKEDAPLQSMPPPEACASGCARAPRAWRRRRRGKRFSFAAGCLGGHYLAGEERFGLEWDSSDDSVWFDHYTFSRPAHPLSVIGYPVVRMLQWRFRRDCSRSVAQAAARATVERALSSAAKAQALAGTLEP